MVQCASEKVRIFDERGELVRTLCGTLPPMVRGILDLEVGNGTASVTFTLDGSACATWDGLDDKGTASPMGFYHLVIAQTFLDGTQSLFEKTFYWGNHAPLASTSLNAQPNFVTAGGTIHFTAQVDGNPAGALGGLKIYTLSGEFLRSLDLAAGQADWDLTNLQGGSVASGIYLVVLDTKGANGNPARKVIKVGIKH